MTIYRIYNTLLSQIKQLLPNERKNRLENFAWLLAGIYQSRSVHLSRIASKLPWKGKLTSNVRRLSRLLDNSKIRVRKWYELVSKPLIEAAAGSMGEIRLILDTTKVSFSHQLLMVSMAFRRRAIPIAWSWVRSKRGHSSSRKQLALLSYVRRLIPEGVKVSVVGDTEFSSIVAEIDKWGWDYALRLKRSILVKIKDEWVSTGDLVEGVGQSLWIEDVLVMQKYKIKANLLIHWKAGEEEPWILVSSFADKQSTLRAYKRRMWIDEMFGDFKGNGFDLERSHLGHFMRLSRLTLAVALLYVWLISEGSRVIKRGLRHLVDRRDRRDLSIFRIGYNMVERMLALGERLEIRLIPYFP